MSDEWPTQLETHLWNIVNTWAQCPRHDSEADDRLMIAVLEARRILLEMRKDISL